jgi:eukaryotic-like serine/threonine-protein kinase
MDCPACHKPNVDGARFCAACGALLPTAAAEDNDPLVGQVIGGRYRVTQLLGEGGMGRVYLAEQQMGTNVRKVAVKTLQAQFAKDPQVLARFHRECGTVSELEHPNTIQFFDFGQTPDGQLYIAMEFVQGESVSDALKRGPMPADRAVGILAQVCGSLEEAHSRGVIHRDLKPDNIILTQRAGRPDFVKVLDFGIAKRSEAKDQAQEQKLTQQGMVLGTPPYMSPEQFTGKQLDARSDIYSLGVMAYEMLTGRLPFEADTPWQWATQHLTAQPLPFESLAAAASIPQPVKATIIRALAKEPDNRQSSVRQFYEEISGVTPIFTPTAGSGGTAAMPALAQAPGGSTAAMPAAQAGAFVNAATAATPAAGFGAPGGLHPYAPVIPAYQPTGSASSRGGSKGLIIALASIAGLLAIVGVVILARSMKPKEDVVVENPFGAGAATAQTGPAGANPNAAMGTADPIIPPPAPPPAATANATSGLRPKGSDAGASAAVAKAASAAAAAGVPPAAVAAATAAAATAAPTATAAPAPTVNKDAACAEANRLANNRDISGAVRAYAGCAGSPGAAAAKASIQREAPAAVQAKIFNGDCAGARAIAQAASSIGAGGPANTKLAQNAQCK